MRLNTKITQLAVIPVVISLAVSITTLLLTQQKLDRDVDAMIVKQGYSEAAKVADSVYLQCVATDARNRLDVTRDEQTANRIIDGRGGIHLADQSVPWTATNQATGSESDITLPKMMIGNDWLGQVISPKDRAPVVDEIQRLLGVSCGIYQRMNPAGDMLMVCTSVLTSDGKRTTGSFLPAVGPTGTGNEIIQTVLNGHTYHGRIAYLGHWYEAAYSPILDRNTNRVVGMTYVGMDLGPSEKLLHDAITRMTVGKTGYVYVLRGSGKAHGSYVVSYKGQRDGENIWEDKDADGQPFVQQIVDKAAKAKDGAIDYSTYSWKNAGDQTARVKFVALTYFAPWDWVIGAGAYRDDFADIRGSVLAAKRSMLTWVTAAAGVVALLAAFAGILLATRIVRPIDRLIHELTESSGHVAAAADQVSVSSQSLSSGSTEQAASLEETSSSLEEMSSMTKRNSDNASKANDFTRHARQAADAGAADMQAMTAAMTEIKTSSDGIAKIIKTIDEIAFQTNILALNAAVEAARAGEAGLGFAVVADEVRALAQRSADAARETASRIEGAIDKTSQGVQISTRVAGSLSDIVEKVRQVDELVTEVTSASHEQSQGVQQINAAVSAMDKVVQANAAAAEESASAAEELNAQATTLRQSIEGLRRLVDGDTDRSAVRRSLLNGEKTKSSGAEADAGRKRLSAAGTKSASLAPGRLNGRGLNAGAASQNADQWFQSVR